MGGRGGEWSMQDSAKNLEDTTKPDRWQYAEALEKVGKPAVEYLIHALKDRDKWVRYVAADALGNIGDPCCADELVIALTDEDQDVRFAVAGALGKVGGGNKKALEALTATCNTDNCYVKVAAEEALALLTRPQ